MMRKGFISLILLLLTGAPALADVVVIVRREAQSAGNYVRVCDIARVDGPADQAREVALTVLGPAPVGGESQEITRWDIETRLYEMGVGSRVTFTGNDVVRVFGSGAPARRYDQANDEQVFRPLDSAPERRVAAPVEEARRPASVAKPAPAVYEPKSKPAENRRNDLIELTAEGKERVARAVGDYFADRYREGNGRVDIEVAAAIVGATGAIPSTAYDLRVEGAEGKIPGRAKVTVFVRDEADSGEREVTVAADTEVYGLALVASRNVARGESLSPGDVKVARVKMEWGQNYPPPRAKAVSGREAGRALKTGEVILAEDAVPGVAVKRGQLVINDTSGRGWQLQTKAKALGTGTVGDIITVEDLVTRARYPVRITGHGTVAVVVNKDKIIYNRE